MALAHSMGSSLPPNFVVLEGGTDAASMLIFDPDALPDDYDDQMRNDPIAVIEALFNEGRMFWLDPFGDGGYCLGICLDGELRPEHAAFAREMSTVERFAVPSGMIYFTGIEYSFRRDDARLRKNPGMGSSHQIDAGVYHLTAYEMNYPEGFHQTILRKRIAAGSYWLYSVMHWLIGLGWISTLAMIGSVFLFGMRAWSRMALPIWAALILPAIILSWLRPYREAKLAARRIEREFPDFIAVLRSVDADAVVPP